MLYPRTLKQEKLIAIATVLAHQFAKRASEHDRNGTFPFKNYRDARAVQLPAFIIPEEFGGWGAGLLDSVMTVETLATGDGSTAIGLTMHFQTMGNEIENRRWESALFERICREAVEHGALVNSIATEPEMGSPSRGGLPKTTATPIYANGRDNPPTAWQINGVKSWATMIPALDYFVTPAVLMDGSDQVATVVIPTALPDGGEIKIVKEFDAMGMRSTASHDIQLIDVSVPPANIASRRSSAPSAKDGKIDAWFMLLISASYLGVAINAHRVAIRYAKERVPTALGKPIAEVEGIQRRLGHAELLLRQARVILYQAADLWDRFPERRLDLTASVATAKYTVTNNAIAAVDQCMRVVGGASMKRTLPLERCYRDVRGGLNHPINDDLALINLGKMALAAEASTQPDTL